MEGDLCGYVVEIGFMLLCKWKKTSPIIQGEVGGLIKWGGGGGGGGCWLQGETGGLIVVFAADNGAGT